MEPAELPKEVHPALVVFLTLVAVLGLRVAGALTAAAGWTNVGFAMMCLSPPAGITVFYLLAFRHIKKD